VHRKCNGIRGSTIKVSKSFVDRGCTDKLVIMDRISMDIAASLEFMDKFCYPGD